MERMGLSYRLYGFGQRSPRPQTKLWHSPPWPLYCDGKSWDSPWVTAADIHAVPTLYVLNHNLKLRFKAENVGEMDLWLLKNKSDPN